jgi:hypothetical protein
MESVPIGSSCVRSSWEILSGRFHRFRNQPRVITFHLPCKNRLRFYVSPTPVTSRTTPPGCRQLVRPTAGFLASRYNVNASSPFNTISADRAFTKSWQVSYTRYVNTFGIWASYSTSYSTSYLCSYHRHYFTLDMFAIISSNQTFCRRQPASCFCSARQAADIITRNFVISLTSTDMHRFRRGFF